MGNPYLDFRSLFFVVVEMEMNVAEMVSRTKEIRLTKVKNFMTGIFIDKIMQSLGLELNKDYIYITNHTILNSYVGVLFLLTDKAVKRFNMRGFEKTTLYALMKYKYTLFNK